MSALDTLLYGYRTVLAATAAVSQRSKLNFSSAFTVADNAVTESTDVGLSGTPSFTLATITAMVLSVLRLTSENNALSGSQNDVTIGSNTIIRVTDAGAVTWTGIAADTGRRVLLVHAVGAGGLTLVHASASSVASNRFALPGGSNIALVTNQIAILVYDTTQARWLYVGSVGGGSFTAPSGTGLMTVTGGTMDAAASTVGAGVLTWLATPSSANLASAVTGETGSGALVFGTAPTLSSPVLTIPFMSITTDSATTGVVSDVALPANTSLVRYTNAGSVNIQSLAGGTDGRVVGLMNLTGAAMTLYHDTGATAANRFDLGYATDLVVNDRVCVWIVYDGTSSRWRVVSYY